MLNGLKSLEIGHIISCCKRNNFINIWQHSPPNKKNGALVGSINTPRRKFNFPPNPFSSLEEFFYAMVEYDRNAAHQKQLLFTECHSGVKIIF